MTEVLDRLRRNDSELIRLDITANLLSQWSEVDKSAFLFLFPRCKTIESIHLSGLDLETVLTPTQIEQLVLAIGDMEHVDDLSVFRGGSTILNESLLSKCLKRNHGFKVLLMFQFASLHEYPVLAGALRQHVTLERVTLTLPNHMSWASLDVYAMGFCEMTKLRVLQIRCQGGQQLEALMSPDVIGLLFASKTIESLYLENCGLLDDHMDVMAQQLPTNHVLSHLDVTSNLLTDDALYTMAQILPQLTTLASLDLSGCIITEEAGQALAKGMAKNTVLTHLELEGGAERYRDEFHIPVGHSQDEWMKQVYYYLRLNRARQSRNVKVKSDFVEALNAVSDQLDGLFYFLRSNPGHCEGLGKI